MTNGLTVMGSEIGDIFWDLSPWITYEPGYELGCSIYVANASDTEKEFSLMARLTQGSVVISEEALPVFGNSWFKVAPGDFVRLKGALRFDDSDCELSILLVERETEGIADSVVTVLISPASANVLPPSWPGSTGTGTDWSSLLGMMLPVMMLGMVAVVMKPKSEKQESIPQGKEERKLLPAGRQG